MSAAPFRRARVPLNVVFFDLETTGLKTPDIIQIGAVNLNASDSFDDFVLPLKEIDPRASEVNKIVLKRDGNLYKTHAAMDQRVYAKPASTVLQQFVHWLRTLQNGAPVALVAYNAHKFDAPILLRQLDRFKIPYEDVIAAFVDPFIFVNEHGLSDGSGKKQGDLMRQFGVRSTGEAHNAVNDADNLRKLSVKINEVHPGLLEAGEGKKHFMSTQAVRDRMVAAKA